MLAELDLPARLALFRTSRALARTVLLHAPSAKRLTKLDVRAWPPALARLLRDAQLQPLTDLELIVEANVSSPPPTSISRHVARLHLSHLTLTPSSLAAWRLHDARLWPHLHHLTVSVRWSLALWSSPQSQQQQGSGASILAATMPAIPGLQSFSLFQVPRSTLGQDEAEAAASLAARAQRLHLSCDERAAVVACTVVRRLVRLTHARLDVRSCMTDEVMAALLRHPALEHVELDSSLGYLTVDRRALPCRWRTLSFTGRVEVPQLALLPLAGLERLTVHGWLSNTMFKAGNEEELRPKVEADHRAGVALLEGLHARGALVLLPMAPSSMERELWPVQPAPGASIFRLSAFCCVLPPLVRLVAEAGPGVDTLWVENGFFNPRWLREAAPLLQRSGRITTLYMALDLHSNYTDTLLPGLPACITRVEAAVTSEDRWEPGDCFPEELAVKLTSVVRGAASSLRRPLTLRLCCTHDGGWPPGVVDVSDKLEKKLKRLAREGGGMLKLRVVGPPLLDSASEDEEEEEEEEVA